jgi:3-oxoacyl-[acyl-carrier-protein] synthase-3
MESPRDFSAIITGCGHFLPEQVVSSIEVEERVRACGFDIPHGIIQRLTGVAYRRYCPEGVSSDLAAEAARLALQDAGLSPLDIDLLIFASATHDVAEPATAGILQAKTGCLMAHAMDIKNACNSFLNALDVASGYIQLGRARRVLIACGEVLSPVINWQIQDPTDFLRKIAALTLGDGGGACILEAASPDGRGVLPGKFFSDGRHWQLSTVLSGGTLLKRDASRFYFESESARLYSLALEHIPTLMSKVLQDLSWELSDVNMMIPHQVSISIIKEFCRILDYPLERCMVTVDRLGNIAAASIPVAISLARLEGRICTGDRLLLVGGAAGFSAGVVPVVF